MSSRTLVTGFLGFGGLDVNPSALLAASLGRPFEVLEVSFAAVDDFLDRVSSGVGSFDELLMLGLRRRGTRIELERFARNHIGPEADVHGVVRGPAAIEPGAAQTLPATLFDAETFPQSFPASDDAGCYLCNYIYYGALRRLPAKRVGFVHVPPSDVLPLDAQRRLLLDLIDAVART